MTALIYTIVIALLVAADQLTKWIVVSNMELGQTITAIDGLLDWTYILNDGASFGMMGGQTMFLIVVTCLVMGVLAYFLYSGSIEHITGIISVLLIIAGGIGNLIDRIFNDGKVIDFIDIDPIFSFPKFNVADCCVTCGGVLLCVFVIFFYEDKEKKAKKAAAVSAEAGTVCTGEIASAQTEETAAEPSGEEESLDSVEEEFGAVTTAEPDGEDEQA